MIVPLAEQQAESLSAPSWQILWNWSLPLWASLALVILITIWIRAWYTREISSSPKAKHYFLSALRLAALALVILMFAQPTLQWFRYARPRLAILIDQSASMATADVSATQTDTSSQLQSRLAAIKHLLVTQPNPLLDQLAKTYQLEVIAFDSQQSQLNANEDLKQQLLALEPAPSDNRTTNLGAAINYTLAEIPTGLPTAVLIFSDGIITSGPTLDEIIRQTAPLQIPQYTVAVGSERRKPDVAIENLLVEDQIFPGDRLQVEATLRATSFTGKSALATLTLGEKNEIVAQTEITLPPDDQPANVTLTVQPKHPGQYPLVFSIEPQAEETDTSNNKVQQSIQVSDQKIRTLLVSASPSYEFRALKSLLQRDPALDLHVLLQEADFDFSEIEDTAITDFPSEAEQLAEYDVLILCDTNPDLLSQQAWPALEQFVSRDGGGLVAIAGPGYLPRAYREITQAKLLLPIDSSRFASTEQNDQPSYQVEPTTFGKGLSSLQLGATAEQSKTIWAQLPPVTWRVPHVHPKPAAQILAVANSTEGPLPMIMRQFYGAGEVLFHAFDETWRWRWQTDDRYFARYWGQAVRRLARTRLATNRQGVQLKTDRQTYQPGEPVNIYLRLLNPAQLPTNEDQITLELTAATSATQQITLNRHASYRNAYITTLKDLLPDQYQLLFQQSQSGEVPLESSFTVQQPPKELARIAADRPTLEKIAKQTGAQAYTIEDAHKLLEALPQPQLTTTDTRPPRKLWNNPLLVGLIVLLLSAEWLLRRKVGML